MEFSLLEESDDEKIEPEEEVLLTPADPHPDSDVFNTGSNFYFHSIHFIFDFILLFES